MPAAINRAPTSAPSLMSQFQHDALYMFAGEIFVPSLMENYFLSKSAKGTPTNVVHRQSRLDARGLDEQQQVGHFPNTPSRYRSLLICGTHTILSRIATLHAYGVGQAAGSPWPHVSCVRPSYFKHETHARDANCISSTSLDLISIPASDLLA